MKTTLIVISIFLISSDSFGQIRSEIDYFLDDLLLQELKVYDTQSSSSKYDYPSNSTNLDRTFHIDRTKRWMTKKYYCCSNQVNHYIKKYNAEWKIVEEFYFKVFINKKDTINQTVSKYTYDEDGKLIMAHKYSFYNNDSLIIARPSKTTQYYYNKKNNLILREETILKDNDPNKIERRKAVYDLDKKGRTRKMSYFTTEINSTHYKVSFDHTYKYFLLSKNIKKDELRYLSSGITELTISKYKKKKLIKKEVWSDNKLVRKVNYSYKDNLLREMELVFIYESYTVTNTSKYEFIRNQNSK